MNKISKTFRFFPEVATALLALSYCERMSQYQVIERALSRYISDMEQEKYEKLLDIIGKIEDGEDLGSRPGETFVSLFGVK